VRKVGTLLAIALSSGAIGCAKKVAEVGCVQQLSENIRVGASEASAEQALYRCGFSYSFDPKTSTILAVKRGEKTGAIREDWSVRVKLDEAHNVMSLKTEKVFTGP
jgi:hypothetical protein